MQSSHGGHRCARPQPNGHDRKTKGLVDEECLVHQPLRYRDDLDVVVPLDRLRRSMINYEITSWKRGSVAARRGWDTGIKGKIRGSFALRRGLALRDLAAIPAGAIQQASQQEVQGSCVLILVRR